MTRHSVEARRKRRMNAPNYQRNCDIYEQFTDGRASFGILSKRYGISRERVRQIVRKEQFFRETLGVR